MAWLLTVMVRTAGACTEAEAHSLSTKEVAVSEVDQGYYRGNRKYEVRCGDWSAQAIMDRQAARIALTIEGPGGKPVLGVPAGLAFRLFGLAIERMFESEGRAARYSVSIRDYAELGNRMAAAAPRASGWDLRRGRPRSGNPNLFVRDLLNGEALFSELAGVARSLGYQARARSVEKVLVCPDPRTNSRAPCGAQVWFELLRVDPH